MPTINQLPPIDQVSGGNQIPTYYSGSGDARKMSVSLLQEYMQDNLSFPGVASNASGVNYNPPGAGAVTRTVESKLRDVVSVKDFGAVGDGVADDTAAIQAAVTSLSPNGGAVLFPVGTYKVTSAISVSFAVWKPVLLFGNGNSVITSTHDGTVINDSTGNVRVENLRFSGPGQSNVNAIAISSILSQGWVRGCYFTNYRVGVSVNNSTSALIERNHFSVCQEGVRSTQSFPAFSNILTLRKNWFDFCTYGAYLSEIYGATLDDNAWEYNAVGFYANNVRLLDIRGCNWFESNSTNAFQIGGSSTGTISPYTRVVANTYTISSASAIDDQLTKATVLLRRSAVQSIPHNSTTDLTWDVETFDPSGMHTGSSADVTIARQGIYQIQACVQMEALASPGANTLARIAVKRNGSVLREVTVPMVANMPTCASVAFAESLAVGDILQVSAYQNTGSALNASGGAVTSFAANFVCVN